MLPVLASENRKILSCRGCSHHDTIFHKTFSNHSHTHGSFSGHHASLSNKSRQMSAFLAVWLPISGQVSTMFPMCMCGQSFFFPPPAHFCHTGYQYPRLIFLPQRWKHQRDPCQCGWRYFLKSSRRHNVTHMILKCHLLGYHAYDCWVKVNILVPPDLNILEISEWERVMIKDIPIMPLFDLLVIRMQGWWDHCNLSCRDFWEKEAADDTSFALPWVLPLAATGSSNTSMSTNIV